MSDPYAESKRTAARAAADLVESGMRLGLGTGSTFTHALDRLAERIRDENLEFVGIPTSRATETRARELGLPLTTLDEVEELDLAIDGADEVDPEKCLIKGGGGALVREKIVATAARDLVIVVTENKMVSRLGDTFRLPVEVIPFGTRQVASALRKLQLEPHLRYAGSEPLVTDNGNLIYDCEVLGDASPADLDAAINAIPGVLDNGLFVGMTKCVLIGKAGGAVDRID